MTDSWAWLQQNAIAVIAAIVSALAALASIRAARKSIAAQNRMLQIEEARERDRVLQFKKANLIASLIREPGSRTIRDLLRIENTGDAEARDLNVILDGHPVLEHPAMPRGQDEVRQVGPRSHFQYLIAVSFQTKAPSDVRITWSDDSGEPGSYRTTLTF